MSASFHAQICLSEAFDALNCDSYAPEYKVTRINQERADYIEAYHNPNDADELAELRRAKAEQVAEDERLAEVERIEAAAVTKHEAEKKPKAEAFADEVVGSGAGGATGTQPDATVKVVDKVKGKPWLGQVEERQAPQKRTALAINTKLIQDFCEHGGIEAGQSRRILSAIEAGEIVNISINY